MTNTFTCCTLDIRKKGLPVAIRACKPPVVMSASGSPIKFEGSARTWCIVVVSDMVVAIRVVYALLTKSILLVVVPDKSIHRREPLDTGGTTM
jgi:hypothetical protein